jgi:hypothetical protein
MFRLLYIYPTSCRAGEGRGKGALVGRTGEWVVEVGLLKEVEVGVSRQRWRSCFDPGCL